MESVPVDGAVPVHRDTKDVLRFLALPGMWIYPAGHPEDLVSLLSVTRHLGNLPSVRAARPSPRTCVSSTTLLLS